MADNTKIWPIFRSANWWLSDDLFTGIKNSFYYSNNIEIREDAKAIYPKQSPRWWKTFDLWLFNTAWAVVASLYFNSAWYIFTAGNVFKLNISTTTATPLWVDWWLNGNILDAELFNWYVYFSTNSHLYRISQTVADADWATEANFTKININSSIYHPLYATDILLAVGNGNEVSKVTKEVPDQVQSWIELQTDYLVQFINELWWFLRITATDWYYWNEILLWDKVSEAADEVIPMSWYKFKQSCIYNWYHYLLSDKWIGLINWYQYYILKRIDKQETTAPAKNWMIVYDDKLYFVRRDWIYIYWAKNKNYNDVLNLWSSVLDNYSYPWALSTDWESILYSETGRSWGQVHTYVYLFKDTWVWWDWEFQTMWYYWSSLSEIKQSMYLRIWYNIYWWALQIFYRTEATWDDWIKITQQWWLDSDSNMRSPFATSIKLNCRFQRIQFKFVFTWWVKLYSADLYYNDMLD